MLFLGVGEGWANVCATCAQLRTCEPCRRRVGRGARWSVDWTDGVTAEEGETGGVTAEEGESDGVTVEEGESDGVTVEEGESDGDRGR